MIRTLKPLQLNPGRVLRTREFMDIPEGTTLALPETLEDLLIREGFAARIREKAVIEAPETR